MTIVRLHSLCQKKKFLLNYTRLYDAKLILASFVWFFLLITGWNWNSPFDIRCSQLLENPYVDLYKTILDFFRDSSSEFPFRQAAAVGICNFDDSIIELTKEIKILCIYCIYIYKNNVILSVVCFAALDIGL